MSREIELAEIGLPEVPEVPPPPSLGPDVFDRRIARLEARRDVDWLVVYASGST